MALYPPIVASSMPAFDINTGKVKVYYTLSTYNTARKDDIQKVQVSVRRQSSNVNVLSSETIEKTFGLQDDADKALNRYYIEVQNSDFKAGSSFEVNALYKVQLRFYGSNLSTTNINAYSQWSTVCIVKPIQAPEFYIDDFYTGVPPKETDYNNFYYSLANFTGVYKQNDSYEALKHWRIRLLSEQYIKNNISSIQNFTLADSGWVLNSANNYNLNNSSVVLSCSLPYELEDQHNYKLFFEIQTKNGYYGSFLYFFSCNLQNINPLVGNLNTYINEEEGYVKLQFESQENKMTNLLIRRTDSRSNFLKWEDLKYFEAYDDLSFTYYDFTIQSGLFYRYLIQKVDARGRRGIPLYDQSNIDNTGIMAEWEHAFLLESTGNGSLLGVKQLKLKYDFQISSYKTNVSESKTDTIGSKYPYIRRNGNMYYRTFPITGIITQFMDEADLFTSSQELFNNKFDQYKNFKGQIGLSVNQYDYTYERKFREKVEEFLYNSKPKLYKSMQQGNIFIKLMDVSLTPKNELGRLVYSFSATAYQIDKAEIQTYNNYNLIQVGIFNPNISQKEIRLGQITSYDFDNNIMGNMFRGGQDIIGAGSQAAKNSIAKLIKYNQSFNSKIVKNFDINWLRITIESDPYLIVEYEPNKFRPYDDIDLNKQQQGRNEYLPYNNIDKEGPDSSIDFTDETVIYPLYQIESTYKNVDENGLDVNVYLGWLFEIHNNGVVNQIIISPPNNIYEFKEDSFYLKMTDKIIPAKDIAMLVDFRTISVIQEDPNKIPKMIRINNTNGQLIGTYDQSLQLISQIKYKYKYNYDNERGRVKRFVNLVKTVSIDTQPGTIVELKTSVMQNYNRFIINETGELNFDPNDSTVGITYLKIVGRNIIIKNQDIINEGEIPKEGNVIKRNNLIYYFHNSKWYSAEWMDQDNNILSVYCPVDAIVFYFVAIEEDTY